MEWLDWVSFKMGRLCWYHVASYAGTSALPASDSLSEKPTVSTVKILSATVCCPLSSFCVLQIGFPFMLVRKLAGLEQHCQYCTEPESPTISALR